MATPPKRCYTYLQALDAAGWLQELSRLCILSAVHNLGLHIPDERTIISSDVETRKVSIRQIGGPYLKFIVNVALPDAPLVKEFERWLAEVRNVFKLDLGKPGPSARNTQFDKHVFSRWRASKIVEFADLLAWRASLPAEERRRWSKAKLGRVIERSSSKDVNTTERILKQALASLTALGAQVAHEMQDENTRDAIANQIAKNIRADLPRNWTK